MPAPVAPAPTEPPPDDFDLTGTQCEQGEVGWFSCRTAQGKVMSLCGTWPLSATEGTLTYRFGPLGAPELTYPGTPTPFEKAYHYRHDETAGGMGRPAPTVTGTLSFSTSGTDHAVTMTLAEKNTTEIVVPKGGKELARIACDGDVRGELMSLEGAIDYAPPLP